MTMSPDSRRRKGARLIVWCRGCGRQGARSRRKSLGLPVARVRRRVGANTRTLPLRARACPACPRRNQASRLAGCVASRSAMPIGSWRPGGAPRYEAAGWHCSRTSTSCCARRCRARPSCIDGRKRSYFDQLAWAGPATLNGLSATTVPIGYAETGLPIGVQIIGGDLNDRTTIAFAGMVEREFGGFTPPPML